MDELNMLRAEMAAMKSDLDKNAIVTDRLMQTVMKERSKGLNWYVNAEMIITPFLILFFFGFCYAMKMSIWIAVSITVGCVVSMIIDLKTMRVPTRLINSLSLRDLRTYLVRQKRRRTIQLIVELPLAMAWLVWAGLAYIGSSRVLRDIDNPETAGWIVILTSATIFLAAVAVVYIKSQGVNDSMIEEIDSCEDMKA